MKSFQASSWLLWDETRDQLQEENWKNWNYVEIKQHATEQLLGQWGNQRGDVKYVETSENEIWYNKINRWSKRGTKRDINSNTGLPQEITKISNNLT